MHQRLPKEINPFRLAHGGASLEGQLPLSELKRLQPSLAENEGIVDVAMRFDVDETGTPYLAGHFVTKLSVVCERCLQPMTVDIDIHCLLGLVKNEYKAERLAEQYEPWLVDDDNDTMNPASVVEDELILALPLVPRHDEACLPEDVWYSGEKEVESDKPESPFAVLSALKSKK